jgi:excisionase family DNA binding protein
MESAVYSVAEVAKLLRISRSLAYRWVGDGTLPSIRIGSTVRIPKVTFEQWLADKSRTEQPLVPLGAGDDLPYE